MAPSKRPHLAAFFLSIGRLGRAAIAALALVALAIGPSQTGHAQQPAGSGGSTLFQNVRIFDGTSSRLSGPSNVLVRATRSSASPPARSRPTQTRA
jgi:hypothetical protein